MGKVYLAGANILLLTFCDSVILVGFVVLMRGEVKGFAGRLKKRWEKSKITSGLRAEAEK